MEENGRYAQEIEQNYFSFYFTEGYLSLVRLNLKQMPHLSINMNKLWALCITSDVTTGTAISTGPWVGAHRLTDSQANWLARWAVRADLPVAVPPVPWQ